MDLNLKVDLDELGRHFDDHDTKWELRFADLDHEHATREVAIDECLGSLLRPFAWIWRLSVSSTPMPRVMNASMLWRVAAIDLDTWRLEVEAIIDDLKLEV